MYICIYSCIYIRTSLLVQSSYPIRKDRTKAYKLNPWNTISLCNNICITVLLWDRCTGVVVTKLQSRSQACFTHNHTFYPAISHIILKIA